MFLDNLKTKLDIKKEDTYIYILLISAPLLLTLYRYFSMSDQLLSFFPSLSSSTYPEVYGIICQHFGFWVLLMVIPLLVVMLFFPDQKRNLGFQLGEVKSGMKVLGIGIPIIVLIAYLGSGQSSVQSEYPLAATLLENQRPLFVYNLAYIFFYYVAWEFFFRGFLLFGLKDGFGAMNAILIQTISSCLVHIDKPVEEILGSILAGVIFGIIAIRTNTFWYCFILHATLGILTDWFIIY